MQPQVSKSTAGRGRVGSSKKPRASKTYFHESQPFFLGLETETPTQVAVDAELEEIVTGLDAEKRQAVIDYLDAPQPFDGEPWQAEEILQLHMILLEDMRKVANPRTPIGDAIELLCWVFTRPDKDDQPFSLKSCLRVVNGFAYRDSMPDPAMGQFNVQTFREAFKAELKVWWKQLVKRQPKAVQAVLSNDLDFIVGKLLKNPQWANEQLKGLQKERDQMLGAIEGFVVDPGSKDAPAVQQVEQQGVQQ